MALRTFSPGCTSLTAAAATRTRLPGTARFLLLGSAAASGRVTVAAVRPAVGRVRAAAASTRTRCSGAADEPTTLTLITLVILHIELRQINPPRCKEDFNKIKIITSKCMGFFKTMNRIIFHLPDRIPEWISTIAEIDTVFVELHNQSRAKHPWADGDTMEAAINGLRKLQEISLEVSMALSRDQESPTLQPLTAATFDTLVSELSHWVDNPPKRKEDLKKIEISSGKCKDLFPRMVDKFALVPVDILEEIVDITISKFVKLHNQSRGEVPRADANAIKDAIEGVERMKMIFIDGAPGLTSPCMNANTRRT